MPTHADLVQPTRSLSVPAEPRAWRSLLRQVHLWLGVALCIPLVTLGITGSLLVFQNEIDAKLDPALHTVEAGTAQPIARIVAAAQAAVPPAFLPSFYGAPSGPTDSATVRFVTSGGSLRPTGALQVYIDPVRLTVLGSKDFSAGFMRTVHALHANMLMPGREGRSVVGWLGVIMLVLGFSGLILWWPREHNWRAAFVVRHGAQGARLHREIHGAVGIWSLVVFIAVSFSGVYLAFPQAVGAGIGAILPVGGARTQNAPRSASGHAQAIDPDAAVALAMEARPGRTLRSMSIPSRSGQPYFIGLNPANAASGAPMATLIVDPVEAKVASVRDPATYPAGEKLMAWQGALHCGSGLGGLWRGLVFVSGFLPALFALTGVSMWLLKRAARRKSGAQRANLAQAE